MLDALRDLLDAHPACERIDVLLDGTKLFSVNCEGRSVRDNAAKSEAPPSLWSANTAPLTAVAVDGDVVVTSEGPRTVEASFTPTAILESLDGLKSAAEEALTHDARQG